MNIYLLEYVQGYFKNYAQELMDAIYVPYVLINFDLLVIFCASNSWLEIMQTIFSGVKFNI